MTETTMEVVLLAYIDRVDLDLCHLQKEIQALTEERNMANKLYNRERKRRKTMEREKVTANGTG